MWRMNSVQRDTLPTIRAVRRGIRDALGMPTVVLLASMTAFGSLAREGGLTLELALASTVAVWALPGQIVFVEMYAAGGEVVALVLAVSLANARFLPMAMSLLPMLRDGLRRSGWLYVYAHLLSAQSWAYCQRVFPGLPVQARRPYFVAFALIILVVSFGGTALGYVLTGTLPRPLALSLVLVNPIFMLLLLADSRKRPVILALIAGVGLGPTLHLFSANWGVLLTGVIAGSAGYAVDYMLIARRKTS